MSVDGSGMFSGSRYTAAEGNDDKCPENAQGHDVDPSETSPCRLNREPMNQSQRPPKQDLSVDAAGFILEPKQEPDEKPNRAGKAPPIRSYIRLDSH